VDGGRRGGGRVAGYALSAAYPADWASRGHPEGWTNKVGVLPGYRGRGLARTLLTATLRAMQAGGMRHAGLDVDADNPTGALALYAGLGYRVRRRTAMWALPL
jgi:ribosomal protein S18 acetylase RimI-like enzyme